MSAPNDTYKGSGARPYLPGHNTEGIHIAGLGGVGRILRHRRPRRFWCAVTRKSINADPTLRRPSCVAGWNERITEAGNTWGAFFVDQDVYLAHTRSESSES